MTLHGCRNYIIALFIIGVTIFSCVQDYYYHKRSRDFFQRFQPEIEGFVIKTRIVRNSAGLLYLDVTKANVDEFDPRDSMGYYYCVIKNGKAEILESSLHWLQPGDSVSISYAKKRVAYYRGDSLLGTTHPPFLRSMVSIRNLHEL